MFQEINEIKFKIKEPFDFGFLNKYGRVFKVFDDQDSGNICFGTEKDGKKFFVKFAGAKTAEYNGTVEDAIDRLKSTVPIYESIKHKNLIKYIKSEEINHGFAMIFEWEDAECMGRMYPESHKKFMALPNYIKQKVFIDILDFIRCAAGQGYVAIDFYDGSIMYDFGKQKTVICDIDFFKKSPVINDMGRMWGSSIFMSPEEFELGAEIDEITNVYTMGAMAFALFGNYSRDFHSWSLNQELYDVAVKATSHDRGLRYKSLNDLIEDWNKFTLDNNDKRIEYYELLLERELDDIPTYDLPEGYHFEFYKSGDRDDWIEIEKSSKEFLDYAEGLKAWNKYYFDKDNELADRMVFVVDENGEKIATATAFYDIYGKDKSGSAWLHWVAVKQEFQGKGISKPLISYVMNIMKLLGYTRAKIPTQTNTWLTVLKVGKLLKR